MTQSENTDGYVECSECGHPIEQHDTAACQAVPGCACPIRWTKTNIASVRARNGLPRRYDLSQLAG